MSRFTSRFSTYICSSYQHVAYFINGTRLVSDGAVNDLGVLIDPALRFNDHISQICNKARSRIGLLFRGFLSRDRPTLVRAYKIYVRPLLEYCSVVVTLASRPYKRNRERSTLFY